MKYKEFVNWCNERACDGLWSMVEALARIDIMKKVREKPFWSREKEWQRISKEYDLQKVIDEIGKRG